MNVIFYYHIISMKYSLILSIFVGKFDWIFLVKFFLFNHIFLFIRFKSETLLKDIESNIT